MNKNNVTLFFACDDNYIPMFAVVLESIRANLNKDRHYDVKLLHSGNVSQENQNKINNEYSKDNMSVEFVDITPQLTKICDKLHTRDYYSKSTYFRLFIPNLYPNLDKALYLDSDIVLNGDVAELFDYDLGDNFVGAIPDESVQVVPEFRVYVKNKIGCDSYRKYFNAGILLMNLKALRDINFEDLFFDIISEVTFDVAQDQDYLNVICKDHILFIDRCWNEMPIIKDVDEKDIKLIHYNLQFKPWHFDGILYEEYFWKYADQCIYKDRIHEIKNNFNTAQKDIREAQTINLMKNALIQASDEDEVARVQSVINNIKAKYIK